MEDTKQPIIVKKVNKGGHGHHGGAWKVAMADFAIAMMAFFMVMWLLGGTTVEQKAAISSYFKNPSLTEGMSHVAAQGQMGPGGASTSMIKLGGSMELPKGEGQRALEKSNNRNGDPRNTGRSPSRSTQSNSLQLKAREVQRKQYSKITQNIKLAFKQEALKNFKEQLLIDMADEGLRIQIIDKAKRPMFLSGSSKLQPYAAKILNEMGIIMNRANSKISITGHTDATPYTDRIDYSNWELSADRANAARRAMLDGGLKLHLVTRVVGMGASILLDRKHPRKALNRRISILVLNSKALAAIKRLEQGQKKVLARWHSLHMPKNKTKKKPKKAKPVQPQRPTVIRRNVIKRRTLDERSLRNHKTLNNVKPPETKKPETRSKTKKDNSSFRKQPETKRKPGLKKNPEYKRISEPDHSIPEKYRGKPARLIKPGANSSGISLPSVIDPSLLPGR